GHLIFLQLTADGHRLCTASSRGNWYEHEPATSGGPILGETFLWAVGSGTLVRQGVRCSSPIECMAMSGDDQWIAVGCENGAVAAWQAETGRGFHFGRDSAQGTPVHPAWSADEAILRAWDPLLTTGSTRMRWDAAVLSVAFSPDARWLVAGCVDGLARVWDLASGRKLLTLAHAELENPSPFNGGVRAAFSRDGRRIVTVGSDRVVKFWETRRGEFTGRLLQTVPDATTVVLSPDG